MKKLIIILSIISFLGIGTGLIVTNKILKKDIDKVPEEQILIKYGEEEININYSEIMNLPLSDFKKTFDNSEGKYIKDINYSGIPLYKIFEYKNIPYKNYKFAEFLCSDSFHQTLTIDKVKDNNSLYLTLLTDGQPFAKGINKDFPGKDGGPFVIIDSKSEFSNTRIKLVKIIKLK